MSDTTSEVVATVPDTKAKPDMSKVREGKKRKQQERDSMLSDLSKQISVLSKTETVDEKEDGPVVVTKKKQKVDDEPSLKSEIFKAAMLGVLGVTTWYVQSVMFAQKKDSMLDRIQAPPIVTPLTPPVIPVTTSQSLPPPPPKKEIGASGLLE